MILEESKGNSECSDILVKVLVSCKKKGKGMGLKEALYEVKSVQSWQVEARGKRQAE